MVELVWLVPAFPLVGVLLALAIGRRVGEPAAGWIATVATFGSFVAACVVFAGLVSGPEVYVQSLFSWIPAGSLEVDFGFYLDRLSGTMILFITGVGALIHLYSIGYMHGDKDFSKFFLYLNLFVFSMLMLVLGDNLVLTFLGWEGVGACSYFLISFWFTSEQNASAGKKAFITNRVGDWGFMVGIFATFFALGSVAYDTILPAAPSLATTTATFIALMLLIGAIGKSAQLPLFIWLPDAMAGPTPVSALIHAATMVTAGVYLLCRINPILAGSEAWMPEAIGWVGAITALVAATIAVAQLDIKKGLAFSTVSQLGYMFLAVGVGAYWAAIFHMITHAFFKACLFLGSGSVIHSMDEEQDMRRYGNLRKYLPVTALTFQLAWLALAGVPPFAGFWSKDTILGYAFQQNKAMYAVGLIAALFTAYYASRIVFRTFYGGVEHWREVPVPEDGQTLAAAVAAAGQDGLGPVGRQPDLVVEMRPEPPHGELTQDHTPHESPWTMTVPLIVLGVLSTIGGFLNLPFGNLQFLEDWLEPVFVNGNPTVLHESTGETLVLLGVSTVVALGGVLIAYLAWARPQLNARKMEPLVLADGYYYDAAVSAFMDGPGRAGAEAAAAFDRSVVDGAVRGVGGGVTRLGRWGRHLQPGEIRRYALGISAGSVAVLAFLVTRVLGG